MQQIRRLVIVNPIAGGGSGARLWPAVQSRLHELGLSFDSVMTEYAGHAVALARDAVKSGYQMVIGVGGDGTLHEIANGVLATQAQGTPDVIVGVVPVGTGGDFVRSLGIPRPWPQACTRLQGDTTRLIDVGDMHYTGQGGAEHRYFVNVAGLGFDGEVAMRTNKAPKRFGGTIPYLTNLVLTLVSYGNKDVELFVDDERRAGRMNSVIVANGAWFGGGMFIAPQACPDDGLLDVLTIGDIGKLDLLQTMPRVYRGTHLTHPKVCLFRTQQVRVESRQDMWIQADGESLGRAPVAFSIRPQAIRLKV